MIRTPALSPRTGFLAITALAVLSVSVLTAKAQDEDENAVGTKASQALLVDGASGTVLLQKNPDQPFPPASLAKMMTMEVVFEAIEAGRISLDTEYPVSVHAWRTGGAPSGSSTMFADVRSNVSVENLIRGAIIQSANDACIVLAEGIAGSEDAFAALMNERAAELGLNDSHFVNPTGLPAEGQYVTVRDLVTLARHIRNEHPELYAIYSEPNFTWNKIFQRNRNPLLQMDVGADGLGTGFTEASGYALLGVTNRDGRVTYLAMSGLESSGDRADEARRLLDWANGSFATRELYAAGERVGWADVFGGETGTVALETSKPISALLPKSDEADVAGLIRYEGPLTAPVEEGSEVAFLDVLVDGQRVLSEPLIAAKTVGNGNFVDRAVGAMRELAFGWLRAF